MNRQLHSKAEFFAMKATIFRLVFGVFAMKLKYLVLDFSKSNFVNSGNGRKMWKQMSDFWDFSLFIELFATYLAQ